MGIVLLERPEESIHSRYSGGTIEAVDAVTFQRCSVFRKSNAACREHVAGPAPPGPGTVIFDLPSANERVEER